MLETTNINSMISIRCYPRKKKLYIRQIRKRSYKNFTKDIWNEELRKKDWSEIDRAENVEKMVEIYTKFNTQALDMCAPFKTFKMSE